MDAAALTLDMGTGLDPARYRDQLLDRFRNPHIAHETYQIAMDGSQKMPQRIFAPALDTIRRRLDIAPFALATACWLRYLDGRTDAGKSYLLRDPRESELVVLPDEPEARVAALFALPNLVPPELAADQTFRETTTFHLQAITTDGLMSALRESAPV